MITRPNTEAVLAGLKDFQRATVDYVFDRFYGDQPTRRFLVADEVGLGKTLVARGVIARTIDQLWETVPRIDIIYICSNADIARQNVQRLGIPGCEIAAQATRLTLLPLQLHDLNKHRLNFIALTPGTSFEQTGGGGRIEERVLLYCLLDRAWKLNGARAPIYVMQDYAKTATFERALAGFDEKRINEQLADAFVAALNRQVASEKSAGIKDLRARFEELCRAFSRVDSKPDGDATKVRTRFIGELRRLLARVCLAALEPDLIILDEFQRFKHLLEEDTEAGELARDLFDSQAGQGARVLLLSATPYRALSLHHETEDNHYEDFVSLLEFLENGDVDSCKAALKEYRDALPAVRTAEGLDRLRKAKNALQDRLRRVIARTERLAVSSQRGGMLKDALPAAAPLQPADVHAFLGAQSIADQLGEGDMVEYWKSAPYLFNFMDAYALKASFREAAGERDMIQLVRKHPEAFLDLGKLRSYQPLEPANPRLRSLIADTLDQRMWQLLWMPPSLDYYRLAGPFAEPLLRSATKRLVFSAWHMVPRAIAALVSYEAERRMMRAAHPRAELSTEDWTKQKPLLRFTISAERLTGMPLFLLVYPSLVLAQKCDPRELARDGAISAEEARQKLSTRLRSMVEGLGIESSPGGPADERWYWVIPMLLDYKEHRAEAKAWWNRSNLATRWAGADSEEEDSGWSQHVEEAAQCVRSIQAGKLRLGAQPSDLFDVLALGASAAPATAALRAFTRDHQESGQTPAALRDAAARTGKAFLRLFNHAEVIEMIRSTGGENPYWLRVLEYAHGGGIQAMLDEYVHLLKESLGVSHVAATERAEKIAEELIGALTLRTASLRVDEITAPEYAREVSITDEKLHIRFAMRFGDERNDEVLAPAPGEIATRTRKERVRAAFNSPFWPFVLISTSVGQEGLDFHHYCHAISHWNLPANPVDMEQREGRVHRYKNHAVRKNLASQHAADALSADSRDAWGELFKLGYACRPPGENDLVPFWLYAGEAKIERHVPALPFSREVDRLHAMRKALAIYRMVFGQSRQEDLIAYILAEIPDEERETVVTELQINLSPLRIHNGLSIS